MTQGIDYFSSTISKLSSSVTKMKNKNKPLSLNNLNVINNDNKDNNYNDDDNNKNNDKENNINFFLYQNRFNECFVFIPVFVSCRCYSSIA